MQHVMKYLVWSAIGMVLASLMLAILLTMIELAIWVKISDPTLLPTSILMIINYAVIMMLHYLYIHNHIFEDLRSAFTYATISVSVVLAFTLCIRAFI